MSSHVNGQSRSTAPRISPTRSAAESAVSSVDLRSDRSGCAPRHEATSDCDPVGRRRQSVFPSRGQGHLCRQTRRYISQSCHRSEDLQPVDNHFINGTKLLNVAGMTRGRRDGILKSEKTRHVVKIGPMHLKGVWYVVQTVSYIA